MPKAPVVEAAPVEYQFRVVAHWKELPGKPGDYVVRRTADPTDMWIGDKTIFAANCL